MTKIIHPITEELLAVVATTAAGALMDILLKKGLIDAGDVERIISATANMPLGNAAADLLRKTNR